ncbi:MAG: PQQ-binding-like beta-propeller repeat protein [Bacteroidales bacterium]
MKKIKKCLVLLLVLMCSFTIFAQSNNDSVIKFAYLADLHISDATAPAEDLENSVRDINTLKDIDFVIFAGDITEFGSDREILLAKSIIDKLSVPYYIVAGNHDAKWSESGCNTFARVFGYEHFDFEVDGVKFIGCNSGPNMRMAPALVPRESIVWLDSLTNTLPKDKPVIFVNHYPLDDAMLNFETVLDLLGRTNIQVALCGHGHNNSIMNYPGIRGVMGRSNLRTGRAGAGYNLITIADGQITFQERMNSVTKEPWYTIPMLSPQEKTAASAKNIIVAANPVNPANPVRVVWEVQDNYDIGDAAVLAKGMVYYANTAGVVKALDAATGKMRWSYATRGKIFSTPAIAEGYLVIGSSDENIYCLDARLGELIWKVKADKSVLASPAILKGIVYIGSSDGIFRAIELKTGNIAWTFDKIKGFVEAKAWVDKDGVYIGDWASTLYAFNPKSGKLLWSWTNEKGRGLSPAAVWPVKANGKVFVVTPERMTHAIDAATGKEVWRAKGGREAIGLSADGSAVYVKTMQDTVIAFSTTAGEAKSLWRSFTGYGYEIAPSPVTTADDLVFIPTDKGNIFALNAKDGTVVWKYNLSIALINYIQPIGKRGLLVSSMDGKVAILKY